MNGRVIPATARVIVAVLAVSGIFCSFFGILMMHRARGAGFAAPVGLIMVVLAGYALLIGYVHGDAKRRGMRYVMWTWLAILVPNAVGIILYFILRDPMPNYCTGCGAAVGRGFAYCPRCGAGMAPTCPKCNRVSQEGWTHCAYCGTQL